MIVYYNGEYLREEEVRISPNDRGFMLADGVYEVVRSYSGLLFHLDRHAARMRKSLASLRIESALPDEMGAIARELLSRNGMEEADSLVYAQVTRGAHARTHVFPPAGLKPTHYVQVSPGHASETESQTGVPVILASDTRWARCDIKSLALLPNVLAAEEAKEQGAREALFVRDGMAIEGTRSNFGGIRGGTFVTPPESNYMLAGISRSVVLELCARLGIPIELTPVPEGELYTFDELLLIGTSAEVLPIISVNGRRIGNGEPGPFAKRLKEAFGEEVERQRRLERRGAAE